MKKLMLFMLTLLILIFLVGSVSAFEFDNVQSYNEDKREYLIENALGFGDDIAKIRLNTPLENIVPVGYVKVAEFEVENYENYVNVFNEMDFFNLNLNNKIITREFDYKYKSIIQVTNYETVCDQKLLDNDDPYDAACRQVEDGLKDKVVWVDINKLDGLLKGNITIGIFTQTKQGDRIEWIPTLFGERLTEWASWNADMNIGLVSNWAFNETSGKAIDDLHLNNGTVAGAVVQGDTGKFNFSYDFDGVDNTDVNVFNNASVKIGVGTISMWMNYTGSASGNDAPICKSNAYCIFIRDVTGVLSYFDWGGGAWRETTQVVGTNAYHHVVLTFDSGNGNEFWYDGSNVGNLTFSVSAQTTVLRIGARSDGAETFVGQLDNIQLWNRTLTDTEIVDILWNGGSGNVFAQNFLDITLNSPINAFNTTNPIINFNGTTLNSNPVINVSLIIDGVLNETNSSGVNNTDYLFTKTIVDGSHNWTYEICDNSVVCVSATTRTFTIDTSNPLLNVTEPFGVINFQDISINQTIKWNVSDPNIDTCTLEYESVNQTVNCAVNISNFTIGTARTLTLYANDTFGNLNSSTVTWSYLTLQTDSSFNASSFETAQERFTINVTTNGSVVTVGSLTFDGTENTGATITNPATNNYTITKTITIPASVGTKTHNFNLTLVEGIINTTSQTQIINATNFTLCQAAPLNIPFINFTFKNETLAQENITATITTTFTFSLTALSGVNKTSVFTNATENSVYTFCGTPSDRTLNMDLSITYNNDISQQRSFALTTTLSSVVLNQILYLLPTTDGLFSPFVTVTTLGVAIAGVKATITRIISGSPVTITSGFTDGSGFITFFLDPDESYTGVFEKSEFITQTFSFTPNADLRTVTLARTTETITNGSQISLNTTYQITPTNTTLANNTDVTFGFNVTSGQTILLMSLNITNSTRSQLGFVSSTTQGFISVVVNTGNNTQLFAEAIFNTSEESITITRIWLVGNFFLGDYSIFNQLTLAVDNALISEFFRFLLIIFTITGTIIFLTTREITDTSESKIIVITLLIWAFSLVGWLDTGIIVNDSGDQINQITQASNQFGIAILTTIFTVFFISRRIFIRKP